MGRRKFFCFHFFTRLRFQKSSKKSNKEYRSKRNKWFRNGTGFRTDRKKDTIFFFTILKMSSYQTLDEQYEDFHTFYNKPYPMFSGPSMSYGESMYYAAPPSNQYRPVKLPVTTSSPNSVLNSISSTILSSSSNLTSNSTTSSQVSGSSGMTPDSSSSTQLSSNSSQVSTESSDSLTSPSINTDHTKRSSLGNFEDDVQVPVDPQLPFYDQTQTRTRDYESSDNSSTTLSDITSTELTSSDAEHFAPMSNLSSILDIVSGPKSAVIPSQPVEINNEFVMRP